jgi:hypothetical protein
LDSASAKPGEAVKAVVTAPLFSPDHKLVLPEGTVLTGTVVVAKKARSFHRPGQLRFNFQSVDLPQEIAKIRPAAPPPAPLTTRATLEAAEGSGTAPINVDSEGGVQAKESKTRFIAPVISLMLASRAADTDPGHHHAARSSILRNSRQFRGGGDFKRGLSGPSGRWVGCRQVRCPAGLDMAATF